eukprot:TRINITY_DN3780_c0_g4_i1.p2 TRINITY_DN3780_c0_g4~~TRINITY_DN3780_c0_g4_i1.p2  ORF type:complete len:462 (+),score=140.13 TRINITY_DN3780_c0_g4_i1:74-1387(+)
MAGLLEQQYLSQAPSTLVSHDEIKAFKPQWEKYGISAQNAATLRLIEPNAPPLKTRAVLHGDLTILQAALDALSVQETKAVQWILTIFQDILREDSSCFSLFDYALKKNIKVQKPLLALVEHKDTYVADTSMWLLSAIMGHVPHYFTLDDANHLLTIMLAQSTGCSDLGVLEATCNLLKSDKYRAKVWRHPGVADNLVNFDPETAQSQVQYKSLFGMWLATYDQALVGNFKALKVVAKVKDVVRVSRIEKVVRMALTLLRNMLKHKELGEEVVESGLLDLVQQLEFEKWRDAELYDDIRELSQLIANAVQELSNFERYERELSSGKLTWSFVHTSKFWGENVMKFDQNDFRAVKTLATLLLNPDTDATTLAVACHDVGEFCALHPLGKKKAAQFAIKERVMELMGAKGDEYRDLRREALLCCQKIMLNKWQDIDASN